MEKPALLLYCQHSLGMGHLMRALALARALAARHRVVFLNGGPFPQGLKAPPQVEVIDLPPMGMAADGVLRSLDARYDAQEAIRVRRDLILEVQRSVDPALILVELFPFGRKKFAAEIEPMLQQARARPHAERPLVLCSLRDILVGSRRDQQHHDDRAAALVNRYFDGVLIHADPSFARLEESFRPSTPLQVPVHYTGFVHDTPPLDFRRDHTVLVSAGSGSVGGPLYRAAVAAQPSLWRSRRLAMDIVAGPFLDENDFAWLQDQAAALPGLSVRRSVPGLVRDMARAAVSVSQCGYNTAMDLVAARVPAIVVPYSDGREDEQANRAARMARLGLLQVLPANRLDPQALAALIARSLDAFPQANRLDLNGGANTVDIIGRMIARRQGATDTAAMAPVEAR